MKIFNFKKFKCKDITNFFKYRFSSKLYNNIQKIFLVCIQDFGW